MAHAYYQSFLHAGDVLLGWILLLPSDLALLVVALMTSLCVVLARRFTTNQTLLGKCRADRAKLKTLIKEAKAARDKEALERYRRTDATVGFMLLRAEFKPLLVAILPLAALATWCLERMEYLPLQPGEQVVVRVQCPRSSSGQLVHLVPPQDWSSDQGWIRRLQPSERDAYEAEATWTLTTKQSGETLLCIRSNDQSFKHPVEVGTHKYSQKVLMHSQAGPLSTSVELQPRKLFGLLPGIAPIGLAPWLVGYMLLTIPMVFVTRTVLRIN